MIKNEDKDRIKAALNITDVIGSYVSLRKAGVNHKGVCPFHDDKDPSMVVSTAKQMYKCFACGAGGDVIKFVMDYDNISYVEAIRSLAKTANIEIEEKELSDEERKAIHQRETLLNTNAQVQSLYATELRKSNEALIFLKERGISEEMISLYGIGYAPTSNIITMMMNHNKISTAAIQTLTLIKKGDRPGNLYDTFRDRTIYPFYSISGQIIGFTGRSLSWKKSDPFPKFLNSSDSPLFKKEQVIFGLFQAKRSITQMDKVYLVEGQHDVISMAQHGVQNVVCGSGTAFSVNQARSLIRFTKNVVIIFDGDAAGVKATMAAINVLLSVGANVKVVSLKAGEDPDELARREKEKLGMWLSKHEIDFHKYILHVRKDEINDTFKREALINDVSETLSLINNDIISKPILTEMAISLNLDKSLLKANTKKKEKPREKVWKDGVFGLDELKEIDKNKRGVVQLTFDQDTFFENVNQQPMLYVNGVLTKTQLQELRSLISEIDVQLVTRAIDGGKEPSWLGVLKELSRLGMKISITAEEENTIGFLDWYVKSYAMHIEDSFITETKRAEYIALCAEIISYADTTVRTVMMKSYAKLLGVTQADLKSIVQPYLEQNKDRAILEKRRFETEGDLFDFDLESAPAYVEEDEVMKRTYINDHYYPLISKKTNERVAYMFKNEKGGGHTCISDFYMEPLLHIYSRESEANKRVIKLNHMHNYSQYVEWKSSILATLNKVQEKLIDEGSYNFEGSMAQFKRIWKGMSYQFKKCTEMRVFGQQPEDFWAFSNAIIYEEKGEIQISYADSLGVMSYKDKHYYSPAFSEIYKDDRNEDDNYEMERFFVYKEVPQDMVINFKEWARQMDEVYIVNDNGKWGVLMSVIACFRDYIFSQRRFFTTLFFIGPTGSGKSQVAESMRSLFMVPEAPVFNLNFGSDASFFIVLESYANVLSIMEEYNDSTISQTKFQGLKAAVFDGEGRTKVKDIATKTLDRSKINSVPVILGQEAPQQDDGSLSNRTILCEVPYKAKGEWTDHETEIFEKLKRHEQAGLSNVLLEVLSQRKFFIKYFNSTFVSEAKLLKTAVSPNVNNTEGLTRIINSVALLTTTARIIEEYTELELPFTYDTFFEIAVDKVLKQVEMISTSNKLSNFFHAIGFLINQGRIKIGKELKVSANHGGNVMVKASGNKTEQFQLPSVETKVLYLDFTSIYPLYQSTVKDALTQASLRSYFNSNKAYIGLVKSTQFKWFEDDIIQQQLDDDTPAYVDEYKPERKIKTITNNTSAYMFNYDVLRELMDVDFERTNEEQEEEPKAAMKVEEERDFEEYKAPF